MKGPGSPIIDIGQSLADVKNGMEEEMKLPSKVPEMGPSATSIDYPSGVPALARDMQSVVLTNKKDATVIKGVRK